MTSNATPPPPPTGMQQVRRVRLLKRISVIAIAVFGALAILMFAVAAVVLNSSRFHNYVLATITGRASDALGIAVQVQNFAIHPATLSVDIYGISVEGASPFPNPPVLQVSHVHAGFRIASILNREWYLDDLVIEHPVIQVTVDARGRSNIPTIRSSGKSGSTSVFDLGIRHAMLAEGTLLYNDRPNNLDADLRNLNFRASFDTLIRRYSGSVSYTEGHIDSGGFRPFEHSLEASFEATPTTFHLTSAHVAGGGSELNLSAVVNDYNAPVVDAQYQATINLAGIAKALHNSALPIGVVQTTGQLHYTQIAGRTTLDSVTLNGNLASRELNVAIAKGRTAITNISATLGLDNGNLAVRGIEAHLWGGALTAEGKMNHLSGDSQSEIAAKLRGLSLSRMQAALTPTVHPSVKVVGTLNATASAQWGNTLDDLVARTDATIDGNAETAQNHESKAIGSGPQTEIATGANIVPVQSDVHATYSAKARSFTVTNTSLRTPQTDLRMSGIVSRNSSLAFRLQANDLHEFEAISSLFRSQSPDQPTQSLGLGGSAAFQGTVAGSTDAPHLSGQLSATKISFAGSNWKSLRAKVELSPSSASLQNAELDSEPRGRITFNAGVGLSNWSFTKESPVQLQLQGTQLSVSDLVKISGQDLPLTGELHASINLHGTELRPTGSGTIGITNGSAYDEPITSADLKLSGSGDEAHADISLHLPAGELQANVSVRPEDKTYRAQLSSAGLHIDKLRSLKSRNIDATGAVALDVSGQGSFDNPQLDATLQSTSIAFQNQSLQQVRIQLKIADHIANAALASEFADVPINAKARIELSKDYLADISLDSRAFSLRPLLAVYAPGETDALDGQTEIHATLHGPLRFPKSIEAHATVPILKMNYGKSVELAAVSPIHIDYAKGVINLQRSEIRGTDTDLQIQASIPTSNTDPLSVMLLGKVDLQLAQLFDPELRSSGQIQLNINSSGVGRNFGGQVQIVDASLAGDSLPIGLQHGNGTLTLTNDRLEIANFRGTVGGGSVTAQGGITLRPAIQFNLGLDGKGIRILYPQGTRENVDANLRLVGSMDKSVLAGTVSVSGLSFTPAFDLNGFVANLSSGVAAPPSAGMAQRVQLNIALHSTNNVNLVNRTLSVNGTANLQVKGTAADPVLLGQVNLNSGDIILNGNRFVLDGGTIQFVNPSETQAVVNLALNTSIKQYNITMRFRGPVDELRPQFSSDPALPQSDIINLLALGQTAEASEANSAAGLSPSTTQTGEALVASQVSSQITSRVSKIAGISQLSINPVLASGTAQGPPGANITIQQRITGNLFVTFTTNTATTQDQTIQGQYQVSPRVAVSATRDPNGGSAVDVLIKRSW